MSTGTPNPPAGIPAPPTAAQPPPLPSSASASGNSSLHGGSTYPPQYPGQPPLPPTGIYPNSGNMILSNKLGCVDPKNCCYRKSRHVYHYFHYI